MRQWEKRRKAKSSHRAVRVSARTPWPIHAEHWPLFLSTSRLQASAGAGHDPGSPAQVLSLQVVPTSLGYGPSTPLRS